MKVQFVKWIRYNLQCTYFIHVEINCRLLEQYCPPDKPLVYMY